MQHFPRCWDTKTKVSYLQRKIIISSILYYDFNESPISDKQYDELSKQLVELQKDGGIKGSQYEYVFYDFDGTTGFDLRSRLTTEDNEYLTHLAILFNPGKVHTIKQDTKQVKKKGRLI